jgi:hypothetical protein
MKIKTPITLVLVFAVGMGTQKLFQFFSEYQNPCIQQKTMSSVDIVKEIEREGFDLPEEAYNASFHFVRFTVGHECWFSFRASIPQITQFLENHQIDKVAAELVKNLNYPPNPTAYTRRGFYFDKDFELDWWPKDFEGYELYKGRSNAGRHVRMAVDPSRTRICVNSISAN